MGSIRESYFVRVEKLPKPAILAWSSLLVLLVVPLAGRADPKALSLNECERALTSRDPVQIRQSRKTFKSTGELPRVAEGRVRLYRGTGHPDVTQLSITERNHVDHDPKYQPRSGGEEFLMLSEARLHSGLKNVDGVSVTTDYSTAARVAKHILVYDVPLSIFDKLPPGDVTMGERVFKYSIPDQWAVGVIRR